MIRTKQKRHGPRQLFQTVGTQVEKPLCQELQRSHDHKRDRIQQKPPPEDDLNLEYVFEGQNLKVKGGELNEEIVYQLNVDASPKTLDLTDAKQPGPVTSGIYKLDGDTLVLCFANGEMPRPENFVNEQGAKVSAKCPIHRFVRPGGSGEREKGLASVTERGVVGISRTCRPC